MLTDGRTDAGVIGILIAHLRAFSSGELKMKMLQWSQHFYHYRSMGIFPDAQKAANSTVPSPILPNFKPIQEIMAVLVAWKNKEDPIENECPRVVTTSYIDFSDAQGQLTL